MSWIFTQNAATKGSRQEMIMNEQFAHLNAQRKASSIQEQMFANQGLVANASKVPLEVWREMDAQTKVLMRAPNLTLMEDLLAIAKSVSIGKIKVDYRQASNAGNTSTSISGQTPVILDKTAYTYDGNIIPVHQTGYERSWREMEGQRTEGFDGLIDDNANAVRALRDKTASYIYTGDSTVSFDGRTGYGVKNHPNTNLVDLGAGGLNINLATATDGASIVAAFKSIRDTIRITNNAMGDVSFYVSRTIMSNLEQYLDTGNGSNIKVLQAIRDLEGVAAVKEDASLTGNELVAGVVSSEFIRPLVGMASGTFAVPRTMFNSDYQFIVANAVGLELRADYDGRSAWAYAREA
jgi:hypothetical protein